ncbi:MAG: hypothetical protein NZO58_07310 [Gemmataceae bacterium]|nr:hypothetical protein [Gemmataceae bacterium]
MIKLICLPLSGRDDDLHRIPGHRVRRFYIQRHGDRGRLHFMDGTPTIAEFQLGRDDPRVLQWLGLADVADGGRQWLDLAAVDLDPPTFAPRPRTLALEAAG